jgi:hypothetical protein
VYNKKTKIVFSEGDKPVEITITNLTANTEYYYRLRYRLENESEFSATAESWFSTQKIANAAFSFGIQGDSHPEREGKMFNPLLYQQTIEKVAALKPDFYFMMGDDFSIDKLIEKNQVSKENVESVYKTQRYYLGNVGKNPPLFLVNGNHEQTAKYLLDGQPNNPAVLAEISKQKYFPLPATNDFYSADKDTVEHIGLLKDYYSFEWGNALFVVIDPYWHSDSAVDNRAGQKKKKQKKSMGHYSG